MSTTSISLANNHQLPVVGLGVWKIDNSEVAGVVQTAIEVGYRHLDCACDYGNEAEVGAGIRNAIQAGLCQREDLWITSKLWNTYHSAKHVKPALERSLSDLGLDYLDLYLIHFPIATKYVSFEKRYPPGWFFDPEAAYPKMEFDAVPIIETWQAMEELVDAGLVKNIGVCNFTTGLLTDLINQSRIRPSVLQVELHPYLTQEKLLKYCAAQQIAVTGFSPLGALSYLPLNMADASESVLDQPVVTAIANRVQKTPAQVVLRWGVQRGTSIVPKTTSRERLIENLNIFDFELTSADMANINSLNQHRRFNDPGDFCESAFNTFCPIYD